MERSATPAVTDCRHSNETQWPWYSIIAPISWRMQSHVDEGRAKLSFSEWGTGEQEADEIVEMVRDGEMPPWDYPIMHPEARLSDADEQAFVDGLTRTFGTGESGEAAED